MNQERFIERLRGRFWKYVKKTESCWMWTGEVTPNGYGTLSCRGHNRMAHRISFELFVGPIPDRMNIDHLCRNRICVNPSHLEPVTHRENVLRGIGLCATNAKKTCCKRGHDLSAAHIESNGRRSCTKCKSELQRIRRRTLAS